MQSLNGKRPREPVQDIILMGEGPRSIRDFLKGFGLDGLPAELDAFNKFTNMIDYRAYFPLALGLARLGCSKGDKILTIGCGKVPFTQISAALIGCDITAIDKDKVSIDACERFTENIHREKKTALQEGGGNITYVNEDFLDWEPTENRYKAVILPNVLNQPSNPDVNKIAEKALKAIKDGGYVVLADSHKDTGNDQEKILQNAADSLGYALEKLNVKPRVMPEGLTLGSEDMTYKVYK
jgi:SAM-dependent methyltransferase